MASENETVADIVKRVRRECNSYPLPTAAAEMLKLVREIEAAHRREVSELREISNDMRTWFRLYYSCGSDPKSKWWRSCATCRRKSCPINKRRKELQNTAGKDTVAKLRECLKEAVFVMQTLFDKQMPKWRKALEGANDEGK